MHPENRFSRPSLVAFAGLAGFLAGTLLLRLVSVLVGELPLAFGDTLVHLPMLMGGDMDFLVAWCAFWIVIGILVGMRITRSLAGTPSPAVPSKGAGLHGKKSFTLIELLIVIAIIAVLATVVILALNPTELLRAARDANRVSDLATLNQALTLYTEDVGVGMGSSSVVYVSVPDPMATSSLGNDCSGLGFTSSSLPSGWTWHCAASSTYRDVNGLGWLPVDFTKVSSGSPLGNLPVDPTNTTSSGLYYTYVVQGDSWEMTADMESAKYGMGGSHDVVTKDGGQYPDLYEVGTDLKLDPLDYDPSLVGYWKLDEGSGSVAYDSSGHGNTLTWNSGFPTWSTSDCVQNACLSEPGDGEVFNHPSNALLSPTGDLSLISWFQAASDTTAFWILKNGEYGFQWKGTSAALQIYDARYHGTTKTSWNLNQWYQIAMVINGRTASVYVDGMLDSTFTADTRSFASHPLTIGDSLGNFVGLIDSTRLYDRALLAAGIQAIYNAEK